MLWQHYPDKWHLWKCKPLWSILAMLHYSRRSSLYKWSFWHHSWLISLILTAVCDPIYTTCVFTGLCNTTVTDSCFCKEITGMNWQRLADIRSDTGCNSGRGSAEATSEKDHDVWSNLSQFSALPWCFQEAYHSGHSTLSWQQLCASLQQ